MRTPGAEPANASGGAAPASAAAEPHPARAAVKRLAVKRLVLTGFRNYARAALDPAPDGRPVVLVGANGTGKTNLLEAVSLLVPGRGLRGARPEELPHRASADGAWGVVAQAATPLGQVDLATGVAPGERRRQVRIDGKQAGGQAALGVYCAAVWLTPRMDRLFLEGAEERRRFLDRLVFGTDPAHAGRLTAYQNGRRQRLKLLTEGAADPAWLDALERTLARRAVAIAAGRLALVRRLDRAASQAPPAEPFPVPRVAVLGQTEEWLTREPALTVEDRLAQAWRSSRREDAAGGQTGIGPHRSDLAVRYAGRDLPAAQCSTGEQKALLVGLTLASARLIQEDRGVAPLLLLDEVAAHLDPARRAALYEQLLAGGAQVWLTGTEAALFAPLGDAAQFFSVADGRVSRTH